MTAHVTADDIRELLTSTSMDPTLVEWLDEDEAVTDMIEVVSGVLFSDISYSNYDRAYRILATAADLRQQGDWDAEHPTAEDFEAFAQQINEG
jgi:predicted HAD superfamily phosphohydrolase YqeG